MCVCVCLVLSLSETHTLIARADDSVTAQCAANRHEQLSWFKLSSPRSATDGNAADDAAVWGHNGGRELVSRRRRLVLSAGLPSSDRDGVYLCVVNTGNDALLAANLTVTSPCTYIHASTQQLHGDGIIAVIQRLARYLSSRYEIQFNSLTVLMFHKTYTSKLYSSRVFFNTN